VVPGLLVPALRFNHRKGHDPDWAADLIQEHFARLPGTGLLARANRCKGKFRTLLRPDSSSFLAHRAFHTNKIHLFKYNLLFEFFVPSW
jgi:hypothetical protein